jgi:hypothetical protein
MTPAAPTPADLGPPPSQGLQPWRAGVAITLLAAFLVCVSPAVMDWDRMFPDFICFWTAGELMAAGANPYDPGLQARVHAEHGWDRQRDGFGKFDFLPFYYPPWLGLLCIPLVPLGFTRARIAWFFLNLEFALFAGYLLRWASVGRVWNPAANTAVPQPPLWPLLLAPLFIFTLTAVLLGQSSTFVFFMLTLSWRLLEERRDRTAGVALAWLSVKPQLTAILLVGLLIWLLRRRRWQVIGSFVLTAAILAAASAVVVPDWPLQMLNLFRQTPLPTEFIPWMGNTWLLVLKSLGLSGPLLWLAYLLLAVPFLVAVARSAFSPLSRLEDLLSLGILAAFFVAPYARHYDFPVLLIPLVVATARLPRPAGFALVALLAFAPYVQLFVLLHYKEQHQPSVNPLVECTYFWVPLVLAAGWLISGLVKKRVT